MVLDLGYLILAGFYLLDPNPRDAVSAVAAFANLLNHLTLGHLVSGRLVEFVCNAALFVPVPLLGVLTFGRGSSPWSWVAVAASASIGIEATQGLFLAHRSAQIADVAANSLGAGMGAIVVDLVLSARPRGTAKPDAPKTGPASRPPE